MNERLKCIRHLGDPTDEPTPASQEMASEMAFRVVETLVTYSVGRSGSGVRGREGFNYGFYPYGKIPASSTEGFKNLPVDWIGTTLAEMFPFLRKDVKLWDEMRKKRCYPMTSLWPWGVVRRHMTFQKNLRKRLTFLFEEYEKGGGEYHGNDMVSTPDDGDSTEEAAQFEDTDSDVDFV